MTFLIDLDEGTAARRRVPIKLFTSDGTSPDTGASGDSLMYSVNGGSESDLTVVTITAADGMYYGEFAAADVGTLGTIALWHRDGAFAQHVANVNVVNYNPMSSQSNIPLVATVTDVTNQVTADMTAISGDAPAADNLELAFDGTGYDSNLTVFVKDSIATIAGVTNIATDVAAVKTETALIVADTNELQSDNVPGLIAALNDIDGTAVALTAASRNLVAVDSSDSVWDEDATGHQTGGTFGQAIGDPGANAETIYEAVVTDATGTNVAADIIAVKAETVLIVADTNELQSDNVPGLIAALNDIDGSEVTVHSGGIASTAFAAGAIDAASLAADAGAELADAHLDRNMATGTDSGTSAIRTPRDALRALRNRVDLSGNTLTVFDEDDVTAAWTASLTTSGDSNFPTAMDPNG